MKNQKTKEATMVDFSLNTKIALITGASRGIGEAIALTLAEYGARCILVSRKLDGLQAVKNKIEQKGGQADAMSCHTGHLNQIKDLFEKVKNTFGRLDILINNAVTNPHFGNMLDADEGVWDKTNEVNLKGPFFITQHAARLMEANQGGAIVNVASINGVQPMPMQGIYSITKAALISMTKAFAKELAAKNIRVNALIPGLTQTRFSEVLIKSESIYKTAIEQIPLGRHAQSSEMAGAVLYLASDAAS
jgi:NAD(P)-dependent dehydrogenase (short-subunit alcohol dehydrogenase family)